MNTLSCVRALAVLALLPATSFAVTNGQKDEFPTDVMGWAGGAAPTHVATGGPDGGPYLLLDASLNLAAYNADQWAGNYTAAGITAIEADFLNPGTAPLDLRLVFFSQSFNRTTSTVAIPLPADNQWHHNTFPILPSELTDVLGSMTAAETLANTTQFMIRHQTGIPSPGGSPVVAKLGIDNIQAVPEPACTLPALLVLALLRRKPAPAAS